eukprot:gene9397-12656_t
MSNSNDGGICTSSFTAYPISDYIPGIQGHLGIGGIVLGALYMFNSLVTLNWIRQQRSLIRNEELNNQNGHPGLAYTKYGIFPIYIPFLWLSATADAFIGLTTIFLPLNLSGENPWVFAAVAGFAFASQHFVLEGIAFALMQYGCGYHAIKIAAVWAFGWALVTFLVETMRYRDYNSMLFFSAEVAWNVLLLLFYGFLWLAPTKWLGRRTAVIIYARFWSLFRIIFLISDCLIAYSSSQEVVAVGNCLFVAGVTALFAVCKPYVVYWVLMIDSSSWQGGFDNKRSGSTTRSQANSNAFSNWITSLLGNFYSLFSFSWRQQFNRESGQYQPVNPLHGLEVGFNEAQDLARVVDNIGSEGTVKLLNFAFIKFDNKASNMLGAGSFSKVYRGTFRKKPVAIKMLFTQDLNPDVIRRYGNEARILSEITHPNVVNIFGVALMPPSVCIVLEMCEYGSLADVIRGYHSGGINRPSFILTKADRMFLAKGCALGVQALHNYSANLCHRDIKSFNFLIDAELNVKIADLELGGGNNDSIDNVLIQTHTSNNAASRFKFATGMQCTWQAPEVLLGQNYTQKSDIYSLSLVLWEIISAGVNKSADKSWSSFTSRRSINGNSSIPYSECNSQYEIKEKVIRGFRPIIPLGYDPLYVDILIHGWHADPNIRPTADRIVSILDKCWLNCMHKIIFETKHIIDINRIETENLKITASIIGKTKLKKRNHYRHMQQPEPLHNHSPPSSAIMSTLALMQSETLWGRLEDDDSAHLVISAHAPFYILWATRKWTQLTGFLLNEVIALDVEDHFPLYGVNTNHQLFIKKLNDVGITCYAQHLLTTVYKRDTKPFLASLHFYPIFNSNTISPDMRQTHANTSKGIIPSRPSSINMRSSSLTSSTMDRDTEDNFERSRSNDEDSLPTSLASSSHDLEALLPIPDEDENGLIITKDNSNNNNNRKSTSEVSVDSSVFDSNNLTNQSNSERVSPSSKIYSVMNAATASVGNIISRMSSPLINGGNNDKSKSLIESRSVAYIVIQFSIATRDNAIRIN